MHQLKKRVYLSHQPTLRAADREASGKNLLFKAVF
jgi:hypothetical protein